MTIKNGYAKSYAKRKGITLAEKEHWVKTEKVRTITGNTLLKGYKIGTFTVPKRQFAVNADFVCFYIYFGTFFANYY